jgi:hypothetical protein
VRLLVSKPFIINRDIATQGEVYMVQVDKWNSDRDTYLMQRVFPTEESAAEYMNKMWAGEVKQFNQFTDWTGRTATPVSYIEEFTTRTPRYIGWNFQRFEDAGIISSDELSDLNWETEYGLTIGYSVQILKWKPKLGTYG